MQELDKMYNISDPSVSEKRDQEMANWLGYIFDTGDMDRDGQIDFAELEYLNKISSDKKNRDEDEWKNIKGDQEYTEDEFDEFKHKNYT